MRLGGLGIGRFFRLPLRYLGDFRLLRLLPRLGGFPFRNTTLQGVLGLQLSLLSRLGSLLGQLPLALLDTDPLLFEVQFALNRPQHIVGDPPLVAQVYHRRPFGRNDGTVEQLLLPMIAGLARSKQALMEWVHQVGLAALAEVFEYDAEQLAGPRGKHDRARSDVFGTATVIPMLIAANLALIGWRVARRFGWRGSSSGYSVLGRAAPRRWRSSLC